MSRIDRFCIPILLAALFSLCTESAAARDNLLLIVADDVGVDSISCYREGADPPPTPIIDSLAKSGILFRNAWANPVCSPTRATFNTGRYSFRTGVGLFIVPGQLRGILKLSEITLPEVLNDAGYKTGLIGKWHLGSIANGGRFGPNRQGWQHYAGTLTSLNGPFNYYFWPRIVNGRVSLSRNYITTDDVDETLNFINRQRSPWVCCLCFTAAHLPFSAPPAHLHSVDLEGLNPGADPIPFYRSMVQAMDTELGRLFAEMGDELEKTNIIFIGDNGTMKEGSQAPFLPEHAKGTLYEGGVNVPMIVNGPIVSKPGREEAALVHTVDLFGTLSEMAGVDVRRRVASRVKIDSVSMVPYFASPNQAPLRDVVFSEIFWGNPDRGGAAIRNTRYKLIQRAQIGRRSGARDEELYDLQRDPFETVNLLAGALTAGQRRNYDSLKTEVAKIRGDQQQRRRPPKESLFRR